MPILDVGGAQIINMQNADSDNQAMSLGQSMKTYVNGVRKTSVKQCFTSAVVSDGTVTFNLTDDTGNSVFTNVFAESINLFVLDLANQYQFGSLSISEDKKTLTASISKLGLVLGGIIQFISATDGTTVYLQVKGN